MTSSINSGSFSTGFSYSLGFIDGVLVSVEHEAEQVIDSHSLPQSSISEEPEQSNDPIDGGLVASLTLPSAGVASLGQALIQSTPLTSLNRDMNQLSIEGAVELGNAGVASLEQALIQCTPLTSLNLDMNQISTVHIAQPLIQSTPLTSLNRDMNQISTEGAVHIAQVLLPLTSLTEIRLGGEWSASSGTSAIPAGTAENPSNPFLPRHLQAISTMVRSTPLPSLINRFKEQVVDENLKQFDYSCLMRKETDADKARYETLRIWLIQIQATPDYTNPETRKYKVERVLSLLQYGLENPEFLKVIDEALFDSTSSCCDSADIVLNSLEIQMKLMKAADVNGALEVLRSIYILGHLQKIAYETVNEKGALGIHVDQISVHLGYQVALRDSLRILVETRTMKYFSFASLTDVDIANAEKSVVEKLSHPEDFIQFLALQPEWKKRLDKEFTAQKQAVQEPFYNELENLSPDLSSDEYNAQSKAIANRMSEAEGIWYLEKTDQLVKANPSLFSFSSEQHQSTPSSSS